MSTPTVPGVKLLLGGTEFIVPPLSLADVENYGDKINQYESLKFGEQVSLVVDIATAALKRNYPDMTRDAVAGMIGLESMGSVFRAVMNIAGMIPQGEASGEAVAGSPSTSMTSTVT